MPTTKQIGGKQFRLVSKHTKKSIADAKAGQLRAKGKLARVVPGVNAQHKKVYMVYAAASGGATSKTQGQTRIGGYGRRVLKPSKRQTGKSKSVSADKKRKAMQPGKRRSAAGNIYHENRMDRSDLRGNV